MIDIKELKFDSAGLIPAIVVDSDTDRVLTLAYMNEESLSITLEKGLTCFFSRSRQTLWLKGETSGNYQHVVSITADCDKDALLVKVRPDGPACHTGETSCFFNEVFGNENEFSYEGLYKLIEILKKVGEESTEVIIAAKAQDKKETIYEISDLIYHLTVLMVEAGISLDDIKKELASRHVIDKKVKQEKMT